MADKTYPASDRDVDLTHPKPGAQAGISNRGPEVDAANQARVVEHRDAQRRGDEPLGTHRDTTLAEREGGTLLGVDTGTEAERGAKEEPTQH